MLTPPILNNALVFLARCDIKGGEAAAFLQTCQALEAELIRLRTPQPDPAPAPTPDAGDNTPE